MSVANIFQRNVQMTNHKYCGIHLEFAKSVWYTIVSWILLTLFKAIQSFRYNFPGKSGLDIWTLRFLTKVTSKYN